MKATEIQILRLSLFSHQLAKNLSAVQILSTAPNAQVEPCSKLKSPTGSTSQTYSKTERILKSTTRKGRIRCSTTTPQKAAVEEATVITKKSSSREYTSQSMGGIKTLRI